MQAYEADDVGGLISAKIKNKVYKFHTGVPGKHHALNALVALAAADAVGVDLKSAIAALASIKPVEGRGARSKISVASGTATLIDESYNANPASMKASIELLKATPVVDGGRRIAVLGEMMELGDDSPALHAALAKQLVAAKIDKVYAAGELMLHMWEHLPSDMRGLHAGSAVGLLGPLIDNLAVGDVVMVKGSNASKVSAVARGLREKDAEETRN